jgi:hypothetical protein
LFIEQFQEKFITSHVRTYDSGGAHWKRVRLQDMLRETVGEIRGETMRGRERARKREKEIDTSRERMQEHGFLISAYTKFTCREPRHSSRNGPICEVTHSQLPVLVPAPARRALVGQHRTREFASYSDYLDPCSWGESFRIRRLKIQYLRPGSDSVNPRSRDPVAMSRGRRCHRLQLGVPANRKWPEFSNLAH